MAFNSISELMNTDLQAVNQTIIRCLESHVNDVKQMSRYLIESGGKRIRPLVVLLSAKACEVKNESYISMAAIIEFIHTATLLHDDVVDGASLRRGRLTANHVWNNTSAVLVGDFLYSRAFQMMVSLNSMHAMRILADATNVIAEGEVLQLSYRHQPDLSERHYFEVIRCKTAKLFEAAAQLGAVLAQQPLHVEQGLARYGLHIGTAFQLVDDVLDYQKPNEKWGKNIGADLAEGKVTLPLIYALKNSSAALAKEIRQTIEQGNIDNLPMLQEAIVSTGAIDYTMNCAKKEIEAGLLAISCLSSSSYVAAMKDLAHFAISRVN